MPLTSAKTQGMRTAAIRNLILQVMPRVSDSGTEKCFQFIVFSAFLSIPVMVIVIPLLCAIESGSGCFLPVLLRLKKISCFSALGSDPMLARTS